MLVIRVRMLICAQGKDMVWKGLCWLDNCNRIPNCIHLTLTLSLGDTGTVVAFILLNMYIPD